MDMNLYVGKLDKWHFDDQNLRAYGFGPEFLLATVYGFGLTMLVVLLGEAGMVFGPAAGSYVQFFISTAALLATGIVLTMWAERIYYVASRLQSFYRSMHVFLPMLCWCAAFGGSLYVLFYLSARLTDPNILLLAYGTNAATLIGVLISYGLCNKGLLNARNEHGAFRALISY